MKIGGTDYGYCPGYRKVSQRAVEETTGSRADHIVIRDVEYPIVGLPLEGAPGFATKGVIVKRRNDDHPRLAVPNEKHFWQFVGLPTTTVKEL